VEYVVYSLACLFTGFDVASIALDESKIVPTVFIYNVLDFVEVMMVSGGEIVLAYNSMT